MINEGEMPLLWLEITYVFLLLCLLFFLVLSKVPLRFHIYYQKREENDDFVMEVRLPKNIFYHKLVIPVIKLRDRWRKIIFEWEGELGFEQEIFRQGGAEIDWVDDYHLIVGTLQRLKEHALSCGYLARCLKLHKCKFIWQVGTGNPAYTGVITGVLWGTVTPLTAKILNTIHCVEEKPVIEINPDFKRQNFALCLDSIFTLQIGHIIAISSCVFWQEVRRYLKKRRKLGQKGVTNSG